MIILVVNSWNVWTHSLRKPCGCTFQVWLTLKPFPLHLQYEHRLLFTYLSNPFMHIDFNG